MFQKAKYIEAEYKLELLLEVRFETNRYISKGQYKITFEDDSVEDRSVITILEDQLQGYTSFDYNITNGKKSGKSWMCTAWN